MRYKRKCCSGEEQFSVVIHFRYFPLIYIYNGFILIILSDLSESSNVDSEISSDTDDDESTEDAGISSPAQD